MTVTKSVDILEVFIVSSLIAFLVTPFVRVVASKTGYLDKPQNNKIHAHFTPLLGGVAIFLALFIGIISQWDVIKLHRFNNQITSMLTAMTLLLVLGLIDDKIGMEPDIKLFGQFVAAMILFKSGVKITFLENYYLNLFLTYFWIIGMTNSFNLLDNMNGLSAGVAVISSFFFGVIACMDGQHIVAIIAFCVCGASLGFLRHNFPKASIFMGDAGSLVIGFVLSAIAIMGNWRSLGLATSLAVPILVLAYPI